MIRNPLFSPKTFYGEKGSPLWKNKESILPGSPVLNRAVTDRPPMYCVTCRAVRSPALAVTEAESPHLETISPPGLLGLKEEARRNVVEILEKPERRSSDSSFTEALSFYAAREQPRARMRVYYSNIHDLFLFRRLKHLF